MSFDTLKVNQLKEVARNFAVTLEEGITKQEIIAALNEEGVTFENYEQAQKAIEAAEENREQILPTPEPLVAENKVKEVKNVNENRVLVKMDRKNLRYDIQGFTFTQEVPYNIMSEDQAQAVFDSTDGFRLATPKEVTDFYS